MPTENTYDRILTYLKGLLSNRQRHALERDMMQDVFDEEAFEGLSGMKGGDLESDMERLQRKLDARILPVKKKQLPFYYRLAASIALLVGIGGIIYFIFRTPGADLLTEEHKTEKPALRTVTPPAFVQQQPEIEKAEKPLQEKKRDIRQETLQPPVEDLSESKEEFTSESPAASEKKEIIEPEVSAAAEVAAPQAQMKSRAPAKPRLVYSGTVVDNNGEVLPGVTVVEKGTSNGTVSDVHGNFSLPIQDSNSLLTLNYIGFKPLEVEAARKPKDKIVMAEDMMALNEVVVVGYGIQTKSSATGSVSTVRVDDESVRRQIDQPVLIKPVPPGGSLRAFKKWVSDRLDYQAYKEYPGKYKIAVEITIHANGSISNIRVNPGAPDVLAADLKRIISQSPAWTAALRDDIPVDTDVVIRFNLTVE